MLTGARAHSSILAAQLADAPHPADREAALARISDWASELAPGDAVGLYELLERYPLAETVLAGIVEASPYLFDLIRADGGRFIGLLRSEPQAHLSDLIDAGVRAVTHAPDEAEAMTLLRALKAEAALLIALCDIGGVWPVAKVSQALTDLADATVQAAVRFQLRNEVQRGRIKPADPHHPEQDCGLIVLAMGKMGAGELNYSSDIDLIVFYNAEGSSLAPDIEPQPFYVRIAQGISRLVGQRTGEGYVFRVDLRLRPDPASTPVAISTAAALDYYEREGRTWERAAMIKARPCAGDLAAGAAVLEALSPFVWRRHLDYAALADVHDMKRQMHAYKGHSEIAVEGHNVKLGRGGIREIEFFAQTQQLIAGGRHPQLRTKRTLEALDLLVDLSWIDAPARDELHEAYDFLRRTEHRLQMMADEQTHTLPEDPAALERFAHFLGYDSRDAFARELLRRLNRVQEHYSKLFEGIPQASPTVDFTRGPSDAAVLDYLAGLGFKSPAAVAGAIQKWLGGEYRALRAEASQRAFAALVPSLVSGLARSSDPDDAIARLDRFLEALQRGVRLFSLMEQNRDLVSLLGLILGAAPRLSDMLAQQPQVMDGLIDPRFFGAMPVRDEISERLAASLADSQSPEDFLDRLRLFGQENLFLIGVRILSGTVSAQVAGEAFADVAEGIVRTVHSEVEKQFAETHGRIAGQETAVIAMGKLGGREMTAASDLDLILIYDFDGDKPDSDGQRSLQGSQYFARLTHRLISAFTTRTNSGVLYEIDMRLRPSGRSGPVATSLGSFADYQDAEAWTWEHLALTRARFISGSPEFRRRVEDAISSVLRRPRDRRIIANDVLEMREAIGAEKGDKDIWDIKHAKGGLVDVEFIAQFLQLIHAHEMPDILDTNTARVLDNALRLGVLAQADADVLRPAIRLYQDMTQVLRLCLSSRFDPATAGEDLLRLLTRAADEPEFSALEARLRETQDDVRAVFLKILGAPEK